MRNQEQGQVLGIPFTSISLQEENTSVDQSGNFPGEIKGFRRSIALQPDHLGIPFTSHSLQEENTSVDQSDRKNVVNNWMSWLRIKTGSYMHGIRQRVRSAPKKSDNVNGNLSLSSRIMHEGGVERVFHQLFFVEKGENLLKASRCCLSTTAGPIAGIVFISTEKVAFHSDKLIKLSSSEGQLVRVPYKVLIPQTRIQRVISSESMDKPSQKYIQIVTMDNFEFWFMGFKYLQQGLSGL